MQRSLAVGRMLASRRSPAPLRRHLQSRPNTHVEKVANLSEAERALMSKHLAEMDAELQSRLVQQVDAYLRSPTFSNGRGIFNRVLDFCRVPKGQCREKLLWRSSLATTLFGCIVMGQWEKRKCVQYHYEYQKEQEDKAAAAAAAAANQAA